MGMTNPASERPHSEQFLTDVRDLWWNRDFLALVATRLDLSGVRSVVDVGSGLGHWARTLARVLPKGAHVVGVEREPTWVARAAASGTAPEGVTLTFQQGTAEALPFDDASVDLVTCQTLLIHVKDPRAVLAEMARVLKPGGWLVAAEPNNLAGGMISCAHPGADVDDLVASFRLLALCERGKRALGLGDNSLGETLPALLDHALWDDVRTWLNDKTRMARAPYDAEARAFFADERRQ
jgi:SAM-dependent methyltransferase